MTYGIDKDAIDAWNAANSKCERKRLAKMLEDDKHKEFHPLLPPNDVHLINVRVIREKH